MDHDDLARIQRWLQTVVMHPGGVTAGIQSDAARQQLEVAPHEIESVIARSHALTSIERLEIYSRAYSARLVECLRSQFPILAKALGDGLFDEFAADYLQKHPSTSYTLGRLGEKFIDYLHHTRPSEGSTGAWPDFLIDLARLEWEFDQVFDGPGVEGQPLLNSEQLQAIPPDDLPSAKLIPAPCLRLLSLHYPIHEYYRALRRNEEAAPPSPADTHLAITRRDYVVRYFPLSRPQFDLLSALMHGASLGEALAVCAHSHADFDGFVEQVHQWFRLWTSEGFFLSIGFS